ncbi:MAG TPA: hypothetical protein VI488_13915 [Candidatus Angelobacter sp.]
MARISQGALFFLATIFLVASTSLSAQQNTKRLILKDGSYQIVTKWEIADDRVRFYSAERYDWEEVPATLVDWPATEKYNQESEEQRAAMAQRVREHVGKEVEEAPEPEAPTVAPGLRLPDGGGVFLLDTYQGQPQLVEVAQNSGDVNRHTGRNILRAAINPLSLSAKQTIELQGEHAKVQSHLTQPAIYVNVDSGSDPEPVVRATPPAKQNWPADRYGIVRLDKKNGVRVVGNLNVAVYGKMSQKENWIKTTSTSAGDWVKVTPVEALPPGEYAVVELLEKDQINIYVWDFGVNPAAPANANAWTARQSDPAAKDQNPALERRPK